MSKSSIFHRISLVTHIDLASTPPELAYFMNDEEEKASRWSVDLQALYVGNLHLSEAVARRVANGGTLFQTLRGVYLLGEPLKPDGARTFNPKPWSYVWGDFKLYETGNPTVTNTIFLVGNVRDIDLTIVGKYVKEMTTRLAEQKPNVGSL